MAIVHANDRILFAEVLHPNLLFLGVANRPKQRVLPLQACIPLSGFFQLPQKQLVLLSEFFPLLFMLHEELRVLAILLQRFSFDSFELLQRFLKVLLQHGLLFFVANAHPLIINLFE